MALLDTRAAGGHAMQRPLVGDHQLMARVGGEGAGEGEGEGSHEGEGEGWGEGWQSKAHCSVPWSQTQKAERCVKLERH